MEQLNLARRANELVVDEASGVDNILNALEEEGVLADLAELHELIAQSLDTLRLFATPRVSTSPKT